MSVSDCMYCSQDERLQSMMTEICELPHSRVYLFKDQFFRGRCVVAYKKHVSEFFQMSSLERSLFIDDVSRVAEIIHSALHPQKINYLVFGDNVSHMHIHIVPKYKESALWGTPYIANPFNVKALPDAEFQELLILLQEELQR